MKKFLSIMLVLALALAMAIPTFAADVVVNDKVGTGSSQQVITAEYEELKNESTGNVYYVTVAWEIAENDLSYSAGTTTYTWNGSTMKYEQEGAAGVGAGWTGSATVNVTVTNQSNAGITATPSSSSEYELDITDTGAISLTTAAVNNSVAIEIPDTETQGTAQEDTIEFSIEPGDSSEALASEGTVATVTVTIAAA